MKRLGEIIKWLRKIRQGPLSRNNLNRIEGIKPGEINNLVQAQLQDQETLQRQLDDNPGSVFSRLASSTHLTKSRLLALLQESLELWTKPTLFCRVRRLWADVLVVALISLLAAEVFFPPRRAYRVVAAREIPAFHKIQRDDLEEVPSTSGIPETLAQYTGKYSTSPIREKSALSAADLTPDMISLRIEIKSTAVLDKATLPQLVLLVFSSRQPPVGGAAIPAMLYKLESNGSVQIATLQIPSGQQTETAKWLGSADAYIMLRMP
jgi:hypothetical protein